MTGMSEMRIGCAMTGSFCTFKAVFEAWRALKATGAVLTPIMSFNASSMDTRFCTAEAAVRAFADITGKKPLTTLDAVEPIGPRKMLDALVIAPCTGNTLAKLAAGIADTPVTLAAKSHLRNGRPLVIAVSSNDALAQNAKNIGQLLAMRNVYFVPFAQDDPMGKPNSLVARFDLLPDTVIRALEGRQIQPLLRCS
jgi:dipicolinate synthase subunit B